MIYSKGCNYKCFATLTVGDLVSGRLAWSPKILFLQPPKKLPLHFCCCDSHSPHEAYRHQLHFLNFASLPPQPIFLELFVEHGKFTPSNALHAFYHINRLIPIGQAQVFLQTPRAQKGKDILGSDHARKLTGPHSGNPFQLPSPVCFATMRTRSSSS